jgi:hypothetical protein
MSGKLWKIDVPPRERRVGGGVKGTGTGNQSSPQLDQERGCIDIARTSAICDP